MPIDLCYDARNGGVALPFDGVSGTASGRY